MLNFNEFNLNESKKIESPKVKKGDSVSINLSFLQGKPDSTVEAYYDSSFNEHLKCEAFSFLFGGDMMMIAKWDGEKWIS